MKIFRSNDGRILQLAEKEQMEKWDAEMPLIFIGALREKRLPEYRKMYSKSLVKEIEVYIDDILQHVAIPKLISALSSNNLESRLKVSENILTLSESNPDQLKIALTHLEEAIQKETNKKILKTLQKARKNYDRAQKRKQTAKKRKILTQLRKEMDNVDRDYADGKIDDSEYLNKQKEYLKLKREIELAEEPD
ncbi:MAG: hypothetical protein ACTSVU_05000 [Promethearchaeota archaeon]